MSKRIELKYFKIISASHALGGSIKKRLALVNFQITVLFASCKKITTGEGVYYNKSKILAKN